MADVAFQENPTDLDEDDLGDDLPQTGEAQLTFEGMPVEAVKVALPAVNFFTTEPLAWGDEVSGSWKGRVIKVGFDGKNRILTVRMDEGSLDR